MGAGGFRFADMSHRGSILAAPNGVAEIDCASFADIDAAVIETVLNSAPDGLDLLMIVGCGADLRPLPARLRARLRDAGVGCESMATGAAVRTYNMLLDEGRRVAALLRRSVTNGRAIGCFWAVTHLQPRCPPVLFGIFALRQALVLAFPAIRATTLDLAPTARFDFAAHSRGAFSPEREGKGKGHEQTGTGRACRR